MSRQDWQDLRDGMMAALTALDEANGDDGPHKFEQVNAILKAVDFYGYVVVPRHLLDELLDAVTFAHVHQNRPAWALLIDAHQAVRAAVVEAVGPTT